MIKTRFAPSPTGLLHLGNIRTALFNALLASGQGGRFLLRVEDTDSERSRADYLNALVADLRWLGLDWQEGYDADGDASPYRQSQRTDLYQQYFDRLRAVDAVYPCFCSPEALAAERRRQQAAGKPPRYSGTCAALPQDIAAQRLADGQSAAWRFRVPAGDVVFEDLVRGTQKTRARDLGDFVIRRADGTPGFLFSNAVDDALMGVTHVLRGEDHLSNTPRQMLLLQALGLPAPQYGHLPLILAPDGAPLSKRNGARSVAELREQGFLPEAILNYLARLGHAYQNDELLNLTRLAAEFDMARIGRAPARFDEEQLRHWQARAVGTSSAARVWAWLAPTVGTTVPAEAGEAFAAAIRANVRFPEEAAQWAEVVYLDPLPLTEQVSGIVREADPGLFPAALEELDALPEGGFKEWCSRIQARTGIKGKRLFQPLRAALTGALHGPELGPLLALMPLARVRRRLNDANHLRTTG